MRPLREKPTPYADQVINKIYTCINRFTRMEINTHELQNRLNNTEKALLSVFFVWGVTLLYLTVIRFDMSVVGLFYMNVSGHLFAALYGVVIAFLLTIETTEPAQVSTAASNETIYLVGTAVFFGVAVLLSLVNKNISAMIFVYSALWFTLHRGRKYRLNAETDQ